MASLALPARAAAADVPYLFQIGDRDGQATEFALAPGGHDGFKADPLYVVGRSKPSVDWPYIQPGPRDAWGGGRTHSFRVVFALASVPVADTPVTFSVALADTHPHAPPVLDVLVNGQAFEHTTPAGGADASADGDLSRARPHAFDVTFPARLLKVGVNTIDIVSTSGSWVIYDWLGLAAAPGARLGTVDHYTEVRPAAVRGLIERDGATWQPIELHVARVGPACRADVWVDDVAQPPVQLEAGRHAVDVLVRPVEQDRTVAVRVAVDGETTRGEVTLKPVSKLTVYLMPHSHVDIGYTAVQTDVAKTQVNNLRLAMALARRTADYPAGSQFVWNTENLWAVQLFLSQASDAERAEFFDAVKRGQIALDGMYANILNGLCRPEELLRMFRYGKVLAGEHGLAIDSAMLSDVPGLTWGSTVAMSQAGIKYLSFGPNYFDRIGRMMVALQDKPFYWLSPSGKDRVLVWVPWTGYALSHIYGSVNPRLVDSLQERLQHSKYPYDVTYLRWAGHGDNAEPDPALSDQVRTWNARYAWPRFVIGSVDDAFGALEKRYADVLPVRSGDLTPYWEDGAASSARETAMNRTTAERLSQAEAMFALRDPKAFPADAFDAAWRDVLLYSEHTWGDAASVANSEGQRVRAIWVIKQAFAVDGARLGDELLSRAAGATAGAVGGPSFDVTNTESWSRTELVVLSKAQSSRGDRVTTAGGTAVPSQRLASGELAFLASDVPPLATVRFTVTAGDPAPPAMPARATPNSLATGSIDATIDPATGNITGLRRTGEDTDFAGRASGGLNSYVYFQGTHNDHVQGMGDTRVTVVDHGPLVVSLRAESTAPGTNGLVRTYRGVAGSDRLSIWNVIDKKRVDLSPHSNDGDFAQRGNKESLCFGFPFQVAHGDVRVDEPYSVVRPEVDQLAGSNKEWMPVGRWADVSNGRAGVTLATIDAPLLQVGRLTNLVGSQTNPDVWRQTIGPTQTIYSWVMNNYWHTNYRAYQSGPTTFAYVLRPHAAFDAAEAARFGTDSSRPLVVARAGPSVSTGTSFLRVTPGDVLVTGLKPADDRSAVIVRLYNTSTRDCTATLTWGDRKPARIERSDLTEAAIDAVRGPFVVPTRGLVTLRVTFD